MVQESQARPPGMPKQSFRAALGAGRAETKLQEGPGSSAGEFERRDWAVIQTHSKEREILPSGGPPVLQRTYAHRGQKSALGLELQVVGGLGLNLDPLEGQSS